MTDYLVYIKSCISGLWTYFYLHKAETAPRTTNVFQTQKQNSPSSDFVNSSTVDIQHSIWFLEKENLEYTCCQNDSELFALLGLILLQSTCVLYFVDEVRGFTDEKIIFEGIEAEYNPSNWNYPWTVTVYIKRLYHT